MIARNRKILKYRKNIKKDKDIIKKGKKRKYLKKRNEYKINKDIIIRKILILSIFLVFIFKYKNNMPFFVRNNNNKIIENQNYKSFENIKLRYINNTLFKPYLENINIISHIYNKHYKQLKKHKTNIHISVSLNNRYIYPQLVSIESVLINCNKFKTFLTYHILCNPDVTEKTLSILKSLVNKYPLNLEIIFYNMTNTFLKFNDFRTSQTAFYRLATPIIIDEDRIMHLDGDTLTFKDLSKMYKMDLNDNYIVGFLDFLSDGVDYLGIHSERYINDGTALINLEKIRNDNKIEDLFNFFKRDVKLLNIDQTIVNYVFYPKIGIMPSEFVIFNFYDESDIRKYSKYPRTKVNITELIESLNNPTIIHFVLCWPKIWDINTEYNVGFTTCTDRKDCKCKKDHNLWKTFANKTDYYEEILQYIGEK